MTLEGVFRSGVGQVALNPSPIHPHWVLEGNPIASNKVISSSADGTANTYIWDCTAGRFNWFYHIDETLYLIEGGVVVKDNSGITHRLSAGDAIFFPAGSSAEWHVENYVRKIAFCRVPLPRPLLLARRGYRFLKRLTGNGRRADSAPAMFQGS
jgi:uncharacterized cupin superfamily protein